MTTPQTTPTRDEAVLTDKRRVDLPNGYYLYQIRPSDMTCSLHMPDGLHIGNLLSQYAGDFAAAMLASAPAPASGGVDAVAVLSTLNRMVADYLTPETYKARFPESNIPWHSDFPMPDKHHSEAGAHQVNLRRDQAFIRDVIHLQDNPSRIKPREPASLSPAATPVSEAGGDVAVFPADGELMVMENGHRSCDFERWSRGFELPLHMAESGLGRFYADDRTEWAWHSWSAALAKPASSPAGGDVVREALEKVRRWAESRCPCHNEEPNPCPLCGASVENLEACKSAENTLPRELLTTIRAALSQSASAGSGE